MSFGVRHREGKWFIGRGDNRTAHSYKLVRDVADACRFGAEDEAREALAWLNTSRAPYELVMLADTPNVTDADGFPWAGNAS